jgi:Fe2+ transport system protein FeoA
MKKHLTCCGRCERPLTLTSARCGNPLRVVRIASTSAASSRLKEMGLCESAEIEKLVDGNALICSLQGARLAIGRALGTHIEVEEVRA